MKRRDFLATACAGLATACAPASVAAAISSGTPVATDRTTVPSVPPPIAAVLGELLRRTPSHLNTDWDGTMAVEALLQWNSRGWAHARTFAEQWFEHHLRHDPPLSDEEFCRTYRGPRCRVIRTGPLPFSTYSGLYGLSFPLHELYRLNGDTRARATCLAVADAILHVAARDHLGLVLHDDGIRGKAESRFTIPDTLYFVVRALMLAARLDPASGPSYQRQALHQIRTGTDLFLDRSLGLARTVLTSAGLGKTYWCRASGWLMYALTGVLRYLPPTDPEFAPLVRDLKQLADGVSTAAGSAGALRVLVNDEQTPLETTGTAMCLAGILEGVRQGWLPDAYAAFAERAWNFILGQIAPNGTINSVYTGWAITAEQGRILMDQPPRDRGWIPATVLFAARQMAAR